MSKGRCYWLGAHSGLGLWVVNGVPVPVSQVKKVTVVSALSIVSDPAGRYVHWGVVLISVTNLLVIVAMVILFVLALVVPVPGARSSDDQERHRS
jgi:hypothetical protein